MRSLFAIAVVCALAAGTGAGWLAADRDDLGVGAITVPVGGGEPAVVSRTASEPVPCDPAALLPAELPGRRGIDVPEPVVGQVLDRLGEDQRTELARDADGKPKLAARIYAGAAADQLLGIATCLAVDVDAASMLAARIVTGGGPAVRVVGDVPVYEGRVSDLTLATFPAGAGRLVLLASLVDSRPPPAVDVDALVAASLPGAP